MEENVRLGKELHPVIADKLNVADLREPLAFETGFFDLVLCNAVLQHMNSETAESTTIPELARILAPGGVLQREQRAAGEPVVRAVRTGLQNVTIPLGLAAGTTIVSLLASLFSRIGAIGDFGIIAGLGVGMSLIVMLTLLPAARTIIDRRREARGTLTPPRLISNALPGIERIAESLGTAITRRPAPYIVVVLAVTVGLAFAATGLKSEFSIRDILPRGGTVLADLMTLDAAVGSSTEMVSVLVKVEATETRTLLNVHDLTTAFEDERLRPPGAAGPIQGSYELLVNDWTNDSGEPGDNYDPELAALFREASMGIERDPELMEEFLDKLEGTDPAVADVLVNNPEDIDAILLQFPIYSDNPEATKALQEDIEALWFGEDDAITATSETIISITVTDEITDRQTEAISTTIAVALGILIIFFWVTLRQPALGVFAVGPIVLVLICVLGTMALLGIPYTLVTSIITALSIGIGVDYTIHMIHRYREEFSRLRNPEKAAIRTLATTGSALLGSALTTALGLGVLVASPLAASQQFGITAAITIAYSLIFSILLVPPVMTVWGRTRTCGCAQWRSATTGIRLPDSAPTLRAQFEGCFFAGRCPRKLGPECDQVQPPARKASDGDHVIYCHIPLDELTELQGG